MAEVDIQTVYFVAKDMARLEDFYVSALGMPVQFRDENKWTQFRLQRSAFALSSAEEAARRSRRGRPRLPGRRGGPGRGPAEVLSAGGQQLAQRDMGTHGVVTTYQDPEENIFQVFSKSSTR